MTPAPVPPTGPADQSRRRRGYAALLSTALLCLVVAWLVLRHGPVAVGLTALAAVLLPVAVVYANRGR